MSNHTTYRGVTIDMDSFRRENEQATALGNMNVNARGDKIEGGKIVRPANEIARENHRVKTTVVKTGLKGEPPKLEDMSAVPIKSEKDVKKQQKQKKEVELPSGDIVVEGDNSED